jgi:hypothetical protein
VLIWVKNSIEELMDDIVEPNSSFDFAKLSLAHPTGIQGGAYFTKLLHDNKPLYIQTPKSLTKQGFVKNGKKIYCDLMFDINDEEFINWIENLEVRCHSLIFEKSDSWFQTSLDMNDIESAFNTLLKSYKSGKKYLVKANVKVNSLTSAPIVKIYNESETQLTIDDVNHETNIISILEIQGIKFTSRNFQIEIELKQSMVLNTDKIFESCVIKKKTNQPQQNTDETERETETEIASESINILAEDLEKDGTETNLIIGEELANNSDMDNNSELDNTNELDNNNKLENEIDNNKKELTFTEETNFNQNISIEEVKSNEEIQTLEEPSVFDIELDFDKESLETITLKKPNEVYYNLYKQAREKAKLAKKEAVLAYLEAKNIKKAYMLEDIDSSDDSDVENIESEIEEG